jgi:Ca2+-binding EF-hand superfamily protein
MVETEFSEFSDNELQIFREAFLKFDTDHNGFLQVFELHMMYESIGETKVRELAYYKTFSIHLFLAFLIFLNEESVFVSLSLSLCVCVC